VPKYVEEVVWCNIIRGGWIPESDANGYVLQPRRWHDYDAVYDGSTKCPGVLLGRIKEDIHFTTRILGIAGTQVSVYIEPGSSMTVIDYGLPGETFNLDREPICAEGAIWWHGTVDGHYSSSVGKDMEGWIPESYAQRFLLEQKELHFMTMIIIKNSPARVLYQPE
jgi:hypothetical protein